MNTFGEGDIDYGRFATEPARRKIRPHLVIKRYVEAQSPKQMSVVEAHWEGLKRIKSLFL